MNLFTGLGQWNQFFAMAVCGAVCGLIFHSLRILRAPFPDRLWIVIPLDILFSAICLAIFVAFCYRAAYLALRWHIFLGYLLGFAAVWIILHSSVAKICRFVYNRRRKRVERRRESERMRRQNPPE